MAVAVLRAQVEVVQEGILLVPHVHEGRIEARGHFAHFGQVDIAHGEAAFGALAVQLHQELVAHHGDGRFAPLGTDDQVYAHGNVRYG
jgi:hypothetical protein